MVGHGTFSTLVHTSVVKTLLPRRQPATSEWTWYCPHKQRWIPMKTWALFSVLQSFQPSWSIIFFSSIAYMTLLREHPWRTEQSIAKRPDIKPCTSYLEVTFLCKTRRMCIEVSSQHCSLKMWYKYSCKALSKAVRKSRDKMHIARCVSSA